MKGQINCPYCLAGFDCPDPGMAMPNPCPEGYYCMAGKVINDNMASTATVEAAGWVLNFQNKDNSVKNTCNGNTLFIAYNDNNSVGKMTRTMSGSGTAVIKYRSCQKDAYSQVIVYLDGVEISRTTVNKHNVTHQQVYKRHFKVFNGLKDE